MSDRSDLVNIEGAQLKDLRCREEVGRAGEEVSERLGFGVERGIRSQVQFHFARTIRERIRFAKK